MSEQPAEQQPTFVPFVGIVTPNGSIALRRWDLIRGFDSREGLSPADGCLVHIAGEKPIIAKSSPINLANQVRQCEHWCKVREIAEGLPVQAIMQRSQMNGIALPGR